MVPRVHLESLGWNAIAERHLMFDLSPPSEFVRLTRFSLKRTGLLIPTRMK
jgi:hypothetical protein